MEVLRSLQDLVLQRSDEGRLRCAHLLRDAVRHCARLGMGDQAFQHTFILLSARLSELLSSSDSNERTAAVWAVYEMTDLTLPWGEEQKIARFCNMLSAALPSSVDTNVVRLTVKAMGHLARVGGPLTSDFVESAELGSFSTELM